MKIGAITADEVAYAGGKFESRNLTYYLYNGRGYWTISPSYSYRNLNVSTIYAMVFLANSLGSLQETAVDDTDEKGIRPVINLRSDVTFNSGSDGTQNNPYIVQ